MDWKTELERALAEGDEAWFLRAAENGNARVIRFLNTRLSSPDEGVRGRAVRSLGLVMGRPGIISGDKIRELLRRFFWSLNDESGAVPFGVPEAIGEVLAVRPEFQSEFLPLLCSLAYESEVVQTGLIERGVFWALGRVGQAVALSCPEAAATVTRAARDHPDPATRRVAAWAASQFEPESAPAGG
jgi:hypothetical protein